MGKGTAPDAVKRLFHVALTGGPCSGKSSSLASFTKTLAGRHARSHLRTDHTSDLREAAACLRRGGETCLQPASLLAVALVGLSGLLTF